MKKRIRVLALFLTVLMIVGVLPMSIFAIGADENTSENGYTAPTAQQIVESWYKSDSKYWVPIYLDGGKVEGDTVSTADGVNTRYVSAVANNGVGVGITNRSGGLANIIRRGQTAIGDTVWNDPEAAFWCQMATEPNHGISNSGHKYIDLGMTVGMADAVKANLAGLDMAITVKVKAQEGSTSTAKQGFQLGTRPKTYNATENKWEEQNWNVPLFQYDSKAIYDSQGAKVADLSTTEYTDIKILVDVGGSSPTTAGNTAYLFIDGELVSATPLFDEGKVDSIYAFSDYVGKSYIGGFVPNYIRINFGGYSYETMGMYFGDVGVYYYDDTPDGNVTNATRSANTLSYYNDFDALTSVSLAAPVTKVGNLGVIESANFKVLDQGNGDKAVQLGSDSPNTNKTFLNPVSRRGNFRNAGKSFVMSTEVTSVNGKFVNGELFEFVMRDSAGSLAVGVKPIKIAEDGTFYYTDTKSEETTLVKLGEGESATIAVHVDVKNNKYYIYVDGVEKTGGETFLSDADLTKAAGIHANGYSFDDGKIYYIHNFVTDVKVAFDNVTFYYSNKFVGAYSGEGNSYQSSEIEGLFDDQYDIEDVPSAGQYNAWYHTVNDVAGTATEVLGPNNYMLHAGNQSYLDFRNRECSNNTDMENNKGGILDTAGRDFKLEMEMMLDGDLSTKNYFSAIKSRKLNNQEFDINYLVLSGGTLQLATNGVCEPIIDAATKTTFKPTPGKYYRYVAYVDVGGTSVADSANEISMLVYDENDALVATALNKQFLSDAVLDKVFKQTSTLENKGFIFSHVRFQNHLVTGLDVGIRNLYLTYGDDDARGKESLKVALYEDFDRFTQGSTVNNSTTLSDALKNNLYYASAINAPSYKYVDDGKGGNALALIAANMRQVQETDKDGNKLFNEDGTPKMKDADMDRYLNAYPAQITQGKNIIASIDIKLGDVKNFSTSIFQYINRGTPIDNQFLAVGAHIASGGLYYNYYEGDTKKSANICGLSDSVYTTYALELDASANKAWIYINGVLRTPAEGFQPIASNIFSGMGNTLHANEVRAFQFGVKGYTLAIDNYMIYVADEYKSVNENPANGILTNPDDGYLYYYENGAVVANYTAPDGILRTDESGAIVVKERTPFVDWDATISKNSGKISMAPKGAPVWNTTTYNMSSYYESMISKDYSSLKLWSFKGNASNGTAFVIKDSIKTEATTINGTSIGTRHLDLSQYDYLEMDFYTEGIMEYRNAMMFHTSNTNNTGNGGGYFGWYYDFGTDSYNGVKGYNSDDKSQTFGKTKYVFYANQWTTMSLPLTGHNTSNRINMDYVGKDKYTGEFIDYYKLVDSFDLAVNGWGSEYYKTQDGKGYAINGDTYTFFIKDLYIVKNVKVTDLNEVYDISSAGDKIPSVAVGYSGLYTAESGNKYFYSAETHARVINGNYDIPLTKDTYGKDNLVTGYRADMDGVLTPLNGKVKVQTLRTHYYVDGVKQYGDPADNFKYTASDGTVYRINGEGDCTAYVAPTFGKISYTASALKTGAVSTDFETDGLPVSWSEGVGGGSANMFGLRYAQKFLWIVETENADDTNTDRILKVTQRPATVDEFLDKIQSTSYKYNYFEADIKVGDDWNGKLTLNADGNSGSPGGFTITENGILSDKTGVALYQLGDYWTKVTVINVYDSTAGTVTNNIYVNGYLLKSRVAITGAAAGWYTKQFRLVQDGTYTGDNKQGTIYFDNMTIAFSNDEAYATPGPIVDGVVEMKNGDKLDGYLYIAGALQPANTLATYKDNKYFVKADGTLAKDGVFEAEAGKFYSFGSDYIGTLAQSIASDGRYYIDGVVQSGLITVSEGVKYWADPANNNVLVKDGTKVAVDDNGTTKYADIVNYVVTYRNGVVEEADGARLYIAGVMQTTVGKVDFEEKSYFVIDETGLLWKSTNAVQVPGTQTLQYNFGAVGVYGAVLADGPIGSKYYKQGVRMAGYFQGYDGNYYFAENINNTYNDLVETANGRTIKIDGADAVVDIKNYIVTIRTGLYIVNADTHEALLYTDKGAPITAEGLYTDKDGVLRYVGADGKAVYSAEKIEVGESVYAVEEYEAKPYHDSIIGGKFYWNSAPVDGKITNYSELKEGEILFAVDYVLVENGIALVEGVAYEFVDYIGTIANGIASDGKYYIEGVLQQDYFKGIDDNMYFAGADDLVVKEQKRFYIESAQIYVDIAANGIVTVIDDVYTAPNGDIEFFENGVLKSEEGVYADNDGNSYYVGTDGKIQTSGSATFGGITYNITAETYVAVPRHDLVQDNKFWWEGVAQTGVITKADKYADSTFIAEGEFLVTKPDSEELYADGVYADANDVWYKFTGVKGVKFTEGQVAGFDYDANPDTADTFRVYDADSKLLIKGDKGYLVVGGKTYFTDAEGNLLSGKLVDADGLTYDADATTFVAVMRGGDDSYGVVTEGGKDVYYNNGVTVEGIRTDVPVDPANPDGAKQEMYFVNGVPTKADVPYTDGTVHRYGDDGIRYDDKAPYTITIVLKDAEGNILDTDYAYQFWNTDFAYTAPYNGCFKVVITCTDSEGNVIEAAVIDGKKITVEDVQLEFTVTVTYDAEEVHNYELVKTVSATCQAPEEKHYKCTDCGKTKVEYGEKDEDNHIYALTTTAPTCYSAGKTEYVCPCGHSYSVAIAKTAHVWSATGTTVTEVSCGVDGKIKYNCTNEGCTAVKTVTIPATGEHDFSGEVTTLAPTCKTDGYTKTKCKDCAAIYTVIYHANGNHVHDENAAPVEVLTDTVTGDKVELYDCILCGESKAVHVVVPKPVTPAPAPTPGDEE